MDKILGLLQDWLSQAVDPAVAALMILGLIVVLVAVPYYVVRWLTDCKNQPMFLLHGHVTEKVSASPLTMYASHFIAYEELYVGDYFAYLAVDGKRYTLRISRALYHMLEVGTQVRVRCQRGKHTHRLYVRDIDSVLLT